MTLHVNENSDFIDPCHDTALETIRNVLEILDNYFNKHGRQFFFLISEYSHDPILSDPMLFLNYSISVKAKWLCVCTPESRHFVSQISKYIRQNNMESDKIGRVNQPLEIT